MTSTYTIGTLLHQVMATLGDETAKRYADLYPFAQEFARELSRGPDQSIKAVVLTIGSDRTATLPEDYVDFVALCRPVVPENGGAPWLRNLWFNPRLSVFPQELLSTDNDEDDPWADAPSAPSGTPYPYSGWTGAGVVPVAYGGVNTSRMAFTVDAARGVVLVDATQNPGECVLQYISDKTKCGHATPIPYDALTAAKYYVLWQYHLSRSRFTEAREFERLYGPEWRKVKARLSPLGLHELAAVVNGSRTMVK